MINDRLEEIWSELKWYWKIIILLLVLRILNMIYRFFFESDASKKRRKMIENGEIDLKKIYKMKMEMKEAEMGGEENFVGEIKISQINGVPVEDRLGILGATLALFQIVAEKIIGGMTFFKDYVYSFLYATYNVYFIL